jgi:hypothetical protein
MHETHRMFDVTDQDLILLASRYRIRKVYLRTIPLVSVIHRYLLSLISVKILKDPQFITQRRIPYISR